MSGAGLTFRRRTLLIVKNIFEHIIKNAVLAALLSLVTAGVLTGQTPIGTRIDNEAKIRYRYPAGSVDSLVSNVVSVVVKGQAGFVLQKTVQPAAVAPGDSLTYSIVIRDTGTVALSNVVIVDTLSPSLQVLGTAKGTLNGSIVKWTIPTLAAGGKDTLKISAVLQSNLPAGSVVPNKVFGTDSTGKTLVTSVDLAVSQKPLLDLRKTVSKSLVATGDTVMYMLSIRNYGNCTLTTIRLTDTMPSSVSAIAVSPNATISGSVVRFSSDSITSGVTDTVLVTALVGTNLPGGTVIRNAATVSLDQLPVRSGEASSTVRVQPGLAVAKAVLNDTARFNDTLRYAIRYRNTGNITLPHVTIVDTLPAQLTFLSAVPAGSPVNNVYTLLRDSLPRGTADSILITARVTSYKAQGGVITNRASARTDQTAGQDAVAAVPITTSASFAITKSVSRDTVLIGDTLRYTVRVKNTGTIPLTSFTILDTLPGTLQDPVVSPNAAVSGGIVRAMRDTVWMNRTDSVVVTARVAFGTGAGVVIPNTAWASAQEAARASAEVDFVTKASPAANTCRLAVTANPAIVNGNGVSASVLTAFYSDTAGHPKPDGTPVRFVTPFGTFSNGKDTSTQRTVGGYAVDSLRLLLPGTSPVIVDAVISAFDSSLCFDADTVRVEFYPGAIEGTVVDRRNGRPVQGASVTVLTASDSAVGAQVTRNDGKFLIPVAFSGSYRVHTTATDQFNRTVATTTSGVVVDLSGPGQKPPFPNTNSVSGRVFDALTGQPIDRAGTRVALTGPASKASADSTVTDSTGFFWFGSRSGFVHGQLQRSLPSGPDHIHEHRRRRIHHQCQHPADRDHERRAHEDRPGPGVRWRHGLVPDQDREP